MAGRRRATRDEAIRDVDALDLFGAPGTPATSGASAPEPAAAYDRRATSRRASAKPARADASPAKPSAPAMGIAEPDEWLATAPPVDPYAHDDDEDAIPGATPASAISVTMLTRTAKDVIEGAFMPLWIRGEVSDFKRHRNGHWYFCLRDAESQVRCVVWSRDQRGMPTSPDDGMQVTALGQLTMYAARGDVQLSVKAMAAEGDGLWRKALEETRQRLAADGLLDPARRRPLPLVPRTVAVVTSPDGAALRDIMAVTSRRHAGVRLVVVPAKVQGIGAPEELCAALARVDRWVRAAERDGAAPPVDVVIIGRGGGGREDLWAFNDERVARAVAACRVPIVSAVGHEVDVTLCDLVADLRAPTPSAAAESVVPEREALVAALRDRADALAGRAGQLVTEARGSLVDLAGALSERAGRLAERRRARMLQAAGRLHALSPLATLGRGYAVARTDDARGEALTSVKRFEPGMPFVLQLRDGAVRATAGDALGDAPLPATPHAPEAA
jgi:exodeoxyribonuclease VII large subunit